MMKLLSTVSKSDFIIQCSLLKKLNINFEKLYINAENKYLAQQLFSDQSKIVTIDLNEFKTRLNSDNSAHAKQWLMNGLFRELNEHTICLDLAEPLQSRKNSNLYGSYLKHFNSLFGMNENLTLDARKTSSASNPKFDFLVIPNGDNPIQSISQEVMIGICHFAKSNKMQIGIVLESNEIDLLHGSGAHYSVLRFDLRKEGLDTLSKHFESCPMILSPENWIYHFAVSVGAPVIAIGGPNRPEYFCPPNLKFVAPQNMCTNCTSISNCVVTADDFCSAQPGINSIISFLAESRGGNFDSSVSLPNIQKGNLESKFERKYFLFMLNYFQPLLYNCMANQKLFKLAKYVVTKLKRLIRIFIR